MKKTVLLIFLFLVLLFNRIDAQFVTIPDTNFVTYLQTHFPACINGNQLDTTCTGVTALNIVIMDNLNISDFEGVQYFDSLETLSINYNPITNLTRLPQYMLRFFCVGSQLTSLPDLPQSVIEVNVSDNQLTSLPILPPGLETFSCSYNQLTSISNVPANSFIFHCDHNLISSLPPFIVKNAMNFSHNLITDISNADFSGIFGTNQFPFATCDFSNNLISCLPKLPNKPPLGSFTAYNIGVGNNPLTCLPNYIWCMDSSLLALPLCAANDILNNPNNCDVLQGVIGEVYDDKNSNCINDSGDLALKNIPIKIYDMTNNFLAECPTFSNGVFNFSLDTGTYRAALDTAYMPFAVNCTNPGIDTVITISNQNSVIPDIDFEAEFIPGFDLGVLSVIKYGQVFPYMNHNFIAYAGDIFSWYNYNSAAGLSGTIEVTLNGPVTYNGPFGMVPDTIIGNTLVFNIADFGQINMTNGFGMVLLTDSLATIGDTICIDIAVSLLTGDLNPANNVYQYCYAVTNSYDPNEKEVSHQSIPPGFNDWLTYTIHFQNTGTAPANNIVITDTLDSDLDFSTFRTTGYSHPNSTMLHNGIIHFNFSQIMLPDSGTDYYGSMGHIQYKIKPKAGLPVLTSIENTANIYFDFNPAVITNTVNTVVVNSPTSVSEFSLNSMNIHIYPNPASDELHIALSGDSRLTFEIFDVTGQSVVAKNIYSTSVVNLKSIANGVYVYRITSANGEFATGKFVKK